MGMNVLTKAAIPNSVTIYHSTSVKKLRGELERIGTKKIKDIIIDSLDFSLIMDEWVC
jgi:hypothetical protein